MRKRRQLSNAMIQYAQVLFRMAAVIELRGTMRFRLLLAEHRAPELIVFYGDTVNPVGLIAVDSVSVSRINLTDAQRWYREKEKGCIYKGKGRRSGTSHEQERRSHVVHFRNTLTAQSQPEGMWSVERMALSDVGVA
ncbi:hypothetical protein ALC56_05185 [Trachymyrmex septentrionalis]|uniref:Uncharacterized protein n=1 Tax=Trachymyrmex septentrionalis TaxID=34720 RepID=A0A195FHS2_9HYME|nr:hypothetical protein ALC56_05185 [Trachymyrmex septentrionalis]